jgi:hypothetical protein
MEDKGRVSCVGRLPLNHREIYAQLWRWNLNPCASHANYLIVADVDAALPAAIRGKHPYAARITWKNLKGQMTVYFRDHPGRQEAWQGVILK